MLTLISRDIGALPAASCRVASHAVDKCRRSVTDGLEREQSAAGSGIGWDPTNENHLWGWCDRAARGHTHHRHTMRTRICKPVCFNKS